ncbi:MAG: hypothetical protein HDR23_07570 [Lachnospiraceae bacterium]|nr:hypothetical protein [Lachnospiraceae bacterium]
MNKYPTDEELNSLIEELEQQELYAPAHLKEEILLAARTQVRQEEAGSKSSQPVSFLMYTLKMVVGMAAAVLLVFLIPSGNGSNISRAQVQEKKWSISEETRERVSFDERVNERMNQKIREADAAFNELFGKIDDLFNGDLGGEQNEN